MDRAHSQEHVSVQAWGYRVLTLIPIAAVVAFLLIWSLLGDDRNVGVGDRQVAAGLTALALVPVFGGTETSRLIQPELVIRDSTAPPAPPRGAPARA